MAEPITSFWESTWSRLMMGELLCWGGFTPFPALGLSRLRVRLGAIDYRDEDWEVRLLVRLGDGYLALWLSLEDALSGVSLREGS